MPEKSEIKARVEAVFSKSENREYASKFLDEVRENMRDINSRTERAILLTLLLMAVFELLARASIEKVSLGPFEVKDLSLIRKALPIIIAYQFYEITLLVLQNYELEQAYDAVYEFLHKDAADKDLAYFVLPMMPSLLLPMTFDVYRAGYFDLFVVMVYIATLLLYIGIFVFLIYAYYLQFKFFGARDILVWITLGLGLYLLISSILVLRKAWVMT